MTVTVIRPEGDNSVSLARSTGSFNHDCIDEDTVNDADYVDCISGWLYDYYDMGTMVAVDNVEYLKVYGRCSGWTGTTGSPAKIGIKTHGTNYLYDIVLVTSWVTYSYQLNTNPYTGVEWTQSEIDDVLGVVGLYQEGATKYSAGYGGSCSQFYIEVKESDTVSISLPIPLNIDWAGYLPTVDEDAAVSATVIMPAPVNFAVAINDAGAIAEAGYIPYFNIEIDMWEAAPNTTVVDIPLLRLYITPLIIAGHMSPKAHVLKQTPSYYNEPIKPNHVYVVGSNVWTGNQIYASAKDTDHIDEYGEMIYPYITDFVDNQADAESVSASMLRKFRLISNAGSIVIAPNIGMELWDVVQITDASADQSSAKFRVSGYSLTYDRYKGVFEHKIDFTEV